MKRRFSPGRLVDAAPTSATTAVKPGLTTRMVPVTLAPCDLNRSGAGVLQLARQPGFPRYAIEVEPFGARGIVPKVSTHGLEVAASA